MSTTAANDQTTNRITNIFVLMLENHSFDHIFARSGIPGIAVPDDTFCNTWQPVEGGPDKTTCVTSPAPPSMSTDPGHEFEDVVEQLCGVKPCCSPSHAGYPDLCDDKPGCYAGGPYPAITLCGFCQNYATSTSEKTGRPTTERVPDIMACFDTPEQLPVIHKLATEFAICDAWFSSMPGPTWPNRFFVHGASSAGVAQSPSTLDEVEWETVDGFGYEHGSIFDALNDAGHKWQIYQDKHNDFSDDPSHWWQGGWISQCASLKGISLLDIGDFRDFEGDLNRRKDDGTAAYLDTPYTFIEPNYGASFHAPQAKPDSDDENDPKDKHDPKDMVGPTYKGGSSQHPEDDPSGGEGLIKAVYEQIRASPVWDTSVLFVVYDEHGGFADSVIPPGAVPPGDKVPEAHQKLNEWKFDFSQYGVRVPAVVVSPLIPKHSVDHHVYDHTSILATLEWVLGLEALTERDKAACDVRDLLSLETPRTDCPETLPDPVRWTPVPLEPGHGSRDAALPGAGNLMGFMRVLLKTEIELAKGDQEAIARLIEQFRLRTTVGHAVDYVRSFIARADHALHF